MQKRKTKNLDHSVTGGRGKARKTAKAGRKSYSKKSSKASSQRRQQGGGANGRKKQQEGQRRTAYSIADLLPAETIRKLKEMKR